ncbi:type II secretion system protein [Oscillibacter sp.]|uniref:type II secretion system protein n=1 Tax=Oscillibacter sp. TaxID=1945593 RepID=UPI002601D12C|nr:type II secretion system protein [Oscillibacter sp.]MDD3347405.1 type II secretion system protein [Oscillibacter sp.]
MGVLKRTDNRGFSLVELMVGITILGLVAAPLLHAFVTSANTARRSGQLADATLTAQNLAESVESATLSTLRTNPLSALGGTGAAFYSYDGSAYQLSPDAQAERADAYYIGVSGVGQGGAGNSVFNAMISLRADDAYAAINGQAITNYSPMDAVLSQTRDAGEDPDQIVDAAFRSEANVVSNGTYTLSQKARTILMDVTPSADKSTLSATVTYQYKYTYSYDREEYDDFGNAETVHVSNARFEDSVVYTLFPNGYKLSDGMPTLYLLYYPWYVSGSPDDIQINNRGNVPLSLFLVKQWDPDASAFELQAKENTYAASISLRQSCEAADGALIYSNAARNLVTGQTGIGGVTYHIYQGDYLYVNGTFSGDLVKKAPENRIYEVTVDLYDGDYTGSPVYSLRTTKLQ